MTAAPGHQTRLLMLTIVEETSTNFPEMTARRPLERAISSSHHSPFRDGDAVGFDGVEDVSMSDGPDRSSRKSCHTLVREYLASDTTPWPLHGRSRPSEQVRERSWATISSRTAHDVIDAHAIIAGPSVSSIELHLASHSRTAWRRRPSGPPPRSSGRLPRGCRPTRFQDLVGVAVLEQSDGSFIIARRVGVLEGLADATARGSRAAPRVPSFAPAARAQATSRNRRMVLDECLAAFGGFRPPSPLGPKGAVLPGELPRHGARAACSQAAATGLEATPALRRRAETRCRRHTASFCSSDFWLASALHAASTRASLVRDKPLKIIELGFWQCFVLFGPHPSVSSGATRVTQPSAQPHCSSLEPHQHTRCAYGPALPRVQRPAHSTASASPSSPSAGARPREPQRTSARTPTAFRECSRTR